MDIFHRRAQRLRSFRVVSFDPGPATPSGSGHATWRESESSPPRCGLFCSVADATQ
jgi:hypothetical protein